MVTEEDTLVTMFEQIKREQQARIAHRDGLMYTTIAAMAAVGAAVVSSHQFALLMALPPVSVLLGWIYVANDSKVTQLGNYVRDDLSPRLTALIGADKPVFGWEHANRDDRWRRPRKIMQLVADLLAFTIAPTAALIVWWAVAPHGLAVVAVLEHLLVLALAVFIIGEAELHTTKAPTP